VIVVGSVDSVYQSGTTEQKKGYSNSGPRIDVFAPGTDIVSTTSNTNRFGAVTQYPFNSSYKIMSISGTSMASPNVAGLAAQLLQVYPHATPQQIRQKIIDISASNVLYSTGLTNDYTNYSSLHGAPNRYAFQPYNTATNSGVTGAVTVQNTSIRG
jgi:subtilisin family serine protease